MALQECGFNINRDLQELEPHGTPDFPCAGYLGEYTDREEDIIPWHWHEEIELIYVQSGNIKIWLSDHLYHLKKGEGIFINSNMLHLCQADPACEIHSLVFHPSLVSGSENTVFSRKYMIPLTRASSLESYVFSGETVWEKESTAHMIQAFSSISSGGPGYEFTVREELSKVCLSLYQNFEHSIIKGNITASPDMERIRKMLDYIQEHYGEDISLALIAKAADISTRECLRCFKRTIHVSPIQYLLKHRINHAAALLKTSPQSSIAEIATQCGFESPSNFSQLFKRYYKCSPGEYQKKCLY